MSRSKDKVLRELRSIFKALSVNTEWWIGDSLWIEYKGVRLAVFPPDKLGYHLVRFIDSRNVTMCLQGTNGAHLFMSMKRNWCFNKGMINALRA